jgi:hypothetical protein
MSPSQSLSPREPASLKPSTTSRVRRRGDNGGCPRGLTMNADTSRRLKRSPTIQKRLAKFMAQQCFRNSSIEDIHTGTSPSSATGNFSDVKVISPDSEIPWKKLSRITDEEMMALNKEVVDKCYTFLRALLLRGNEIAEGFEISISFHSGMSRSCAGFESLSLRPGSARRCLCCVFSRCWVN